MHLIQTSLVHKILPPRGKALEKNPALIFLHGRGANEDDLLGLSDFLDDRLFFISIRAPYPFEWGGGYTWFEIVNVAKADPLMQGESYRRLMQFLGDAVKAYPIDPASMFLFGFSMGTMMSYSLALSHPELFRGVVANSGYITEVNGITYEWEKIKDFPFFIAHGRNDPVIPVEFGRSSAGALKDAGALVEFHEYPMGHEISEEGIIDIRRWLTKQVDKPS